MSDFTLARKQLKALKQLEEHGVYLAMVERFLPQGYTEYEWEFRNYQGDYTLPRVALHVVHDLLSLGLVMFRDRAETECELSISGWNYLKSLEVNQEDRLDMDVLHRIHQLTYYPVQKEKKRK